MTRANWMIVVLCAAALLGAAVTGVIFSAQGIRQHALRGNGDIRSDQILGTWISKDAYAPGRMTLEKGGRALLQDLTVYDQAASAARPVQRLATDLSTEATWRLVGDSVLLDVPLGEQSTFVQLHVDTAFGPTSLHAYVGDPDAPLAEQVFVLDGDH